MSLKDSSEMPPESWNEAARRKLAATTMRLQAMGEMISWESIRRGMATEDRQRSRWLDANHKIIYGGDVTEQTVDDDQGHLVLGDMSITQQAPQPQPPPNGSGVAKALLGAGLLASGVGIGIAAPLIVDAFLGKDAVPAAENTDTQYELRLDKRSVK